MKKNRFIAYSVLCVFLALTFLFLTSSILASPASPQGQIIKTPTWLFETNQVPDLLIYDHRELMVASGCDVNGDGFDDVLVGDRDYDWQAVRDDNGRAWLYYGSLNGLSDSADVIFTPPYTNNYGFFGAQVACAGDVNGDGYEDIIISMDNYDNSFADEGAIYVYYGSSTGPSTTYSWMARGDATYAHFGISVDSAGDVNGDGYDDIIVGNLEAYVTTHAFVWLGGSGGLGDPGLPSNADWTASSPSPGQLDYGRMVRGIGDVNGDTYDDIMIGAFNYDGGVSNQGAVFVYHGSDTGLGDPGTPANADWSAVSAQSDSRFGYSGDGVGDLNGDGYDDIAVSAFLYDNPEVSEGKVFVWYGSSGGLGANGDPANADWSAEVDVPASLGYALRPGGDVNGDGYADLLATANSYSFDATGAPLVGAGAWFIWAGSASGLGENGTPANADYAGYGDQEQGRLGRDDAGVADVNDDGLSDIFVAAYIYDHPEFDEGVVFGYYSKLPKVELDKQVTPASLYEPGGVFTFTLTITNTSTQEITITALTDDYALPVACTDLAGEDLAPSQSLSCEYGISHTEAGTYENTATVTVEDNEGNTASASASASVTVLPMRKTMLPFITCNP